MGLPVTLSHLYKIPFSFPNLSAAPPFLPAWHRNRCHPNPQPLHIETREYHSCAAPLCSQTGFLSLPVQKHPSPSSLECHPLDLTLYSEFCNPADEGSSMKTGSSTFSWFPQTDALQGVQFSCHGSHTKSPGKYKVQKK